MTIIVLDASALLALLRAEAGATKVAAVIDQAKMSAVNYAEVVSHYAKLDVAQNDIEAMLLPLPVEIIAVDRSLATIAGMLRPLTLAAGLSLGDRCCLALAKREELPAWTADKVWKTVAAATGVKVVLIR